MPRVLGYGGIANTNGARSFAGKAEAAAAVGGGVLVSYTQPADFTRLTGLIPFLIWQAYETYCGRWFP